MRSIGAMLCVCLLSVTAAAGAGQPLTVEAAIETTRLMRDLDSISRANPEGVLSISPGGRRYLLRLVRGDVQRNGVWMEMRTGRLDSIEAAGKSRFVTRLFTSGLGAGIGNFGSDNDVSEFTSSIQWLDDDHVAFLWSDAQSIRQVVRVDLDTGKVDQLTQHPTSVAGFDIGRGDVVVYYARTPVAVTAPEVLEAGYVIPEHADAVSLLTGNLERSGFDIAWNTQWFMCKPGQAQPQHLRIAGHDVELLSTHGVRISPDGRRAIVDSAPREIPADWDKYRGGAERRIAEARKGGRGFSARLVQQPFLVDLQDGSSRPLWDAMSSNGSQMQWSPNGKSVLIAPTYLPPADADERGLDERAAAIVDVASGSYHLLPADLKGWRISSARWLDNGTVEISHREGLDIQFARFTKTGAGWRADESMGRADAQTPARLRIEVREDVNTPPRVFAVDTVSARETLIVDPNPRLTSSYTLGRVERMEGTLPSGDAWSGLLFYPVDYDPGRRYPLVMESVYGAPVGEQFTLYGFGTLGPAPIASYPGQVLANRGIMVLYLNVHVGKKSGTVQEGEARREGFETLARDLIAKGLVDATKVGLVGHSRNGWFVEYTLTHSDFPFAAAIAADNWDPSYLQVSVVDTVSEASGVNGGAPFGDGLKAWLGKAPGFNVEKIHTPLRIVQQSEGLYGVFLRWEIFGRLRYLAKPVEFYVMPDAQEHGGHNTQNPAQIIAVQEGCIDWFDFWLNGREDPDERKAQQYQRWRKLREQQRENSTLSAAESLRSDTSR